MKKGFLLLLLVIALPFFLPWGNPLLTWEQVKSMGSKLPLADLPETIERQSRQITAYRWQDSDGNWHYGSEPPPGDIAYQRMEVDPDTNLIQGLGGKQDKQEKSTELSADDLGKVMKGAGDAGKAMQQQQEKQKAIIE